jgi:hypothetical protein
VPNATPPIIVTLTPMDINSIDPHDEADWQRALQITSDPGTPAPVLALYATGHVWARFAVAGNPSTTPETLTILAGDDSPAIRRRVALHPSTPAAMRDMLSRDPDALVRDAATM